MSMYIGEALVGEGNEVAHIDLMIGDKAGPVGSAFATALCNQSAGHSNLLAVLTPSQRTRWNIIQGKTFDATKLGPMTAKAPELREVDVWINSEPLSFEKLRGQVVALHFWTFG